jgi:hypothetical protein
MCCAFWAIYTWSLINQVLPRALPMLGSGGWLLHVYSFVESVRNPGSVLIPCPEASYMLLDNKDHDWRSTRSTGVV